MNGFAFREEILRDFELEVLDAEMTRLAEGIGSIECARLLLLVEVDLARMRSSRWVRDKSRPLGLEDIKPCEKISGIDGARREEYKFPAALPRLDLLVRDEIVVADEGASGGTLPDGIVSVESGGPRCPVWFDVRIPDRSGLLPAAGTDVDGAEDKNCEFGSEGLTDDLVSPSLDELRESDSEDPMTGIRADAEGIAGSAFRLSLSDV